MNDFKELWKALDNPETCKITAINSALRNAGIRMSYKSDQTMSNQML